MAIKAIKLVKVHSPMLVGTGAAIGSLGGVEMATVGWAGGVFTETQPIQKQTHPATRRDLTINSFIQLKPDAAHFRPNFQAQFPIRLGQST